MTNQDLNQREKNALYSIEIISKARNSDFKIFDSYSSMVSEAKHEVNNRT